MHIQDQLFRFHKEGPYTVVYEMVENRTGTDGKTYIGYLNYAGSWIIAQVDPADVGGYEGSKTKFFAGSQDYAANWAVKESLTYVEYDKL